MEIALSTIGLMVIGGIVVNLLWLAPLYYFSSGVRALVKGGIKWRNPKTWAILAVIVCGFIASFFIIFINYCACTAIQGASLEHLPKISVPAAPVKQGP